MTFTQKILAGSALLALIGGSALASPQKQDAVAAAQSEKLAGEATAPDENTHVKIFSHSDERPFKGRIIINGKELNLDGLDFEGMDFDDFDFSFFDGMEGLDILGNLDIETFNEKDGRQKIVIKNGKKGLFASDDGNIIIHVDRDAKHAKHMKRMRKHKKHAKYFKRDKSADHDDNVHIFARRFGDDGGENAQVWVFNEEGGEGKLPHMMHMDKDMSVFFSRGGKEDGFPHMMSMEDDVKVFIGDDGEVKILQGGKELQAGNQDGRSVKIDKKITNKKGKRKTRIVIEIEEAEDK
jgi:hypothetical protein